MLRRLIQSFKDDTVSPWTRIALVAGGLVVGAVVCLLTGDLGKLLTVVAVSAWFIIISTDYSIHE